MTYIGIDPGLTGAIAVIFKGGEVVIHDTPTMSEGKKNRIDSGICARLIGAANGLGDYRAAVFIERVHAMPGQGVTSMFNFGYGAGVWEGVLAALRIPYQFVTPQAWKKVCMAGEPKDADSRIVAGRLFPTAAEGYLSRKKDHGRADALLIAEYGRRTGGAA